ncbi:unnamed protein product, partial [Meganyctiphanes norvegica]
ELASDGGPEFTATATRNLLRNWGVHHRLSSVAFPHSNCRAELGVKSMKRLLTGNTGKGGSLDSDAFRRALLQYRNTPDRETRLSPAMCLFGRHLRDFAPMLPGKYLPHNAWLEALNAREDALRNRHMRTHDRLSEHTRRLPPLRVGDHVRLQNQTGNFPLKWDRTGVVVEVRQFDQYLIKTDGSNRATLRNRKFLRKFTPVYPKHPPRTVLDDLVIPRPTQTLLAPPSDPILDPSAPCPPQPCPPGDNDHKPPHAPTAPQALAPHPPPSTVETMNPVTPPVPTMGPTLNPQPAPNILPPPRRSERTPRPPDRFGEWQY